MLRSEHETRRHLEPVACFSAAPWPPFSPVREMKAARVTPRSRSRGAGRPPGSPAGGSSGPALSRRQSKQKWGFEQCWPRTGGRIGRRSRRCPRAPRLQESSHGSSASCAPARTNPPVGQPGGFSPGICAPRSCAGTCWVLREAGGMKGEEEQLPSFQQPSCLPWACWKGLT